MYRAVTNHRVNSLMSFTGEIKPSVPGNPYKTSLSAIEDVLIITGSSQVNHVTSQVEM